MLLTWRVVTGIGGSAHMTGASLYLAGSSASSASPFHPSPLPAHIIMRAHTKV
jgi:hypothetical protein